jgi:galactitol-specific phosphotransferase system IIB component
MFTKTYTIIVSCGTAIATSTHVALKLKEFLVVTTAQVPFDLPVPVINGLPFLTGVGLKEVIDSIEQELKAGEEKQ